ncbi:MAG: hypothetical protein KA210_04340 [Bacteroidia bacterium]|nr:hypothetical protein [Bacteroidia bacterium]
MSNLLILGAGVEKTEGIDMPLANELVPQIRDFIYNDDIGKKIDLELRKIIKGLRFNYDDFVKKAVDKLASDFRKEVNQILVEIKNVLDNDDTLIEEHKNLAKIVISLLEKIQKLQEDVVLDDETADLINSVFTDISVTDENIIDLGKLTFTDTFDLVMKKVLEVSIREPNHPVLKYVYKNLMDFENLLLKHFIGFYNENESEIKKYLYISWTLWAFLVYKERKVGLPIPFYSSITNADKVITFNYTSFAHQTFQDVTYFHGDLKKYIRLDNRNQIEIDNYTSFDIVEFIKDIVGSNINFENKRFVIPSIIPPLKLKPVLSNEYINIWYHAVETIRNSEKIIIVGYSFNYADEHFNDLIRKNRDKNICIIDPFAETVIKNLERIFSHRLSDYTKSRIQKKETFQNGNLKIIKAYAHDINIDEIFSQM